ncbi:MAG TPA: ribosomal protein S18-alanine N-acetyltransferase [Gemmatimonadaceae bacterium]|nr:ribosomal protein S18-alanine N-acetyltransferase [Gemmatimonadaceae bacterium]
MTTVASKPLHIRRAVRADLADMLRIEQASFADPWTVDSLATALSLDRMHVLVAESVGEGHTGGDAGNGLLGYVVALLIGPEAEIADLAVAPEARRLGVGRALLERVLAELQEAGARTAYLEVRESNGAARTLYETSGFGSVGRRRRYYRNPVEDALLLMREIGPT